MKMAEVSSRGAQQVDVWKEKGTSFAACAEKLTIPEERVSQGLDTTTGVRWQRIAGGQDDTMSVQAARGRPSPAMRNCACAGAACPPCSVPPPVTRTHESCSVADTTVPVVASLFPIAIEYMRKTRSNHTTV